MSFLKGVLKLRPRKEIPNMRFLKRGAPWVYSNELQMPGGGQFAPGSWVALETGDGQSLGYGYFNPHSLIAFRVFERGKFRSEEQTRALFFKRLDAALLLRQRAYPDQARRGERSFRLCFGESDGVPGLIIDLYGAEGGGVAVLQSHAAGADAFLPWAQQWLAERLGIIRGVVRNDLDVRNREHVPLETSSWGVVPTDVYAMENGIRLYFDVREGQKTGFFYDHRDNRERLAELAANHADQRRDRGALRALDCFSYVGAWGLGIAARHRSYQVTCVDASQGALDFVLRNAEENGLRDRVEVIKADIFKDKDLLQGEGFDVVVSDPPALSSSAKDAGASLRGHEKCFSMALGWLKADGLAALAACSFHMTTDEFLEVCRAAGQGQDRALQFLSVTGQSADHPVLAAVPETRYLKCALVQDLNGWQDSL